MENKIIIDRNEMIVLEVSLLINKELFDEGSISYKMFKNTEESILKLLNKKITYN